MTTRVFLNHNLAIPTKVAIYRAVCVSVMLYGSETWTLYRRHIKAFEAFHIRSLQSILGIRWWQKISHTELFDKAGITPAEHFSSKNNCDGWGMLSECLTTGCLGGCSTASSLRDSVQLVVQRNASSTTSKQISSSATLSQVTWRLRQATGIYGKLSVILVIGAS